MSPDERFLVESGAVIWATLRPGRDFEHGRYGRCRTAFPQAERMLAGGLPAGGCEGCLALFADAVGAAWRQIDRIRAANKPAAYLRTVTARWFSSNLQQRNVERLGKAKPATLDGRAGRVAAAIDDPWLVSLLTQMLADACANAPLPAEVWSFHRFTRGKAEFFGLAVGTELERTVRRDVETVLQCIRDTAGPQWLHDYITAPQQLRAAEWTTLRFGATEADEAPVDVPEAGPAPDSVREALHEVFFDALPDVGPAAALRHAITEIAPDTDVDRLGPTLLRDTVVQLLSDLVSGAVTPEDLTDGAPWDAERVRRIIAGSLGVRAATRIDDSLAAQVTASLSRKA